MGLAYILEGAERGARSACVMTHCEQIEGSLRLREVAEGGTTSYKLCLDQVTLWTKENDTEPCPTKLQFSLTLPTTFSDDKDTYVSVIPLHRIAYTDFLAQPLPPTHDVHLSGVPGFNATIDYKVSATVSKNKTSNLLRLGSG